MLSIIFMSLAAIGLALIAARALRSSAAGSGNDRRDAVGGPGPLQGDGDSTGGRAGAEARPKEIKR
jgi:hypothetical protein